MIVVFEKRSRWTPELQRRFLSEPIPVRGCHSASDVPALAVAAGVACVVLCLDDAEGECLQVLGRLAIRRSRVAVVALGGDRAGGLEWPFRELGATEFLAGTYTAADVARVCRRHVEQAGAHSST
ncbi:MAG: hypothetical protein WD066_19660 [Planctomycetaceae bacterium]